MKSLRTNTYTPGGTNMITWQDESVEARAVSRKVTRKKRVSFFFFFFFNFFGPDFSESQLPVSGYKNVSSCWCRKIPFHVGILSPAFRKENKGQNACPPPRFCICCFQVPLIQNDQYARGICIGGWHPLTPSNAKHLFASHFKHKYPKQNSVSSPQQPVLTQLQVKGGYGSSL